MVRARDLAAGLAAVLAGCAPVEGDIASANSSKAETRSGWTIYTPLENQKTVSHHGVSGTLFVANKRGNTLSKIDLGSGLEIKHVESCKNPHELATSPDGKHVALACYGGRTVDVFLTSTLERIESVNLGDKEQFDGHFFRHNGPSVEARPHGIVWHESGTIYVTAEGRQSIFSIQDVTSGPIGVTEYLTGQQGSHMLAVSPDESLAWTTDLGSKTVTRIDLSGKLKPFSIEVGVEPEGIALTPDGKTLWVSARGSNKAFALDTISLVVRAELDTGAFPLRLAIRPQGDFAVTSDLADGGLTVIDLSANEGGGEVVRQIAVSSAAEAEKRQQVTILWSDDGERIYAAETGSDTVAEVDFASGKVLRRLNTGKGGDGLAILD